MNTVGSEFSLGVSCASRATRVLRVHVTTMAREISIISQLSSGISRRRAAFLSSSRNSESRPRVDRDALNKNGCAREEIYFLSICTTLVILMLILNALNADYIANSFRALHGLAVRAIQCKVVLFVFELVC